MLDASDFTAWMRAVHGHDPFPWQRRLLLHVLKESWPRTLSLPTSSGKTAALDVALFALALEAERLGGQRKSPVRIVMVVDRRIVVDGAHARACRMRDALRSPSDPVVSQVAHALSRLGGEEPLHVALLRGGIYREDRWARTPSQPTILCSTVDQVGSRLLHRGYGVSPATWPIHAGLLGNDALILLDEAHCSAPFLQTLDAVATYRKVAQVRIDVPWLVTAMTATPRDGDTTFALNEEDASHPVLRARLERPKEIQLAPAMEPKEKGLRASLLEAVRAHVRPGSTVLAVVNRVRTARELVEAVEASFKRERVAGKAILLTGRARPVERDALLAAHKDRLLAGRDRRAFDDAPPLVVVATQCVEVGADLDVDALITEACPLDALKQRLGRLNRLGELESATCTVVIAREQCWDGVGDPPSDAIYGEALARTWAWLSQEQQSAPLDGGVSAFARRTANHDRSLDAPTLDAPVVFPSYFKLWAQTGPVPAQSPEPAVFLHGPERASADVQLVWRADLDATPSEAWLDAVALCPPVTGEALAVRIDVAREWMAGRLKRDETSDLEGEALSFEQARQEPGAEAPFVVWRGPERSLLETDPGCLRPGDTLVLPASRGGCDAFGWAPSSETPVVDCADAARMAARRAPVLRLHPSTAAVDAEAAASPLTLAASSELPDEVASDVRATLSAIRDGGGRLARLAEALLKGKAFRVEPHPAGVGVVITGRAGWAEEARDFSDEDDSSSCAPTELPLEAHLADVRSLAEKFCTAVGLPRPIAEDVALAGHLHDLGKADPRFQAWLRDGNRVAALRGAILAKSPRLPGSPRQMAAARERAGYPRGGRHELLSVRLAESQPELLASAHDRDLVLHLVESHHGHCRPFAPVVVDELPVTVRFAHGSHELSAASATAMERLESGVADRFFSCLERYGHWGLSYLEACMRLADHRASERAEGGE